MSILLTKEELIDHDLHSMEKNITTIMEEHNLSWDEAEEHYYWAVEDSQSWELAQEFGLEDNQPWELPIIYSSSRFDLYDWLIIGIWGLMAGMVVTLGLGILYLHLFGL